MVEFLPDPYNDRQPNVPCPPNKPIAESILYPYKGIPIPY